MGEGGAWGITVLRDEEGVGEGRGGGGGVAQVHALHLHQVTFEDIHRTSHQVPITCCASQAV